MKKNFLVLCIVFLFLSSVFSMASNEYLQLIESDFNNWGIFVQSPALAEMFIEDGEINYLIENVGQDTWHVQGSYDPINLIEGVNYRISLDMKSSVPRDMELRIQKDAEPYTGYFETVISLSEEMESFTYDFQMNYDSDSVSKLVFNIGLLADSDSLDTHIITVDNLSLLALDEIPEEEPVEEEIINEVHLNQLGYRIEDVKVAIVNGPAEYFKVINKDNGQVAYKGELSGGEFDRASGDNVYYADFSSLKEMGEYYIIVPDFAQSYSFKIKDDVYNDLQKALQKMFYYQRSGVELEEKYAGVWSHQGGYRREATIFGTSESREVTGGWHDAGDYGRYVVPAAKTVADLMLSYQLLANSVSYDDLGIPESNNSVPDIIDQVRFKMEWMLKMQDELSGGVYHKVTTANFQSMNVLPEHVNDELILSPISATATADFSAVMAMASRVYEAYDEDFADKCLEAAEYAWEWLMDNPSYPGFRNPTGINTGEYGDGQDGDERYWAAIELYLATGKEEYHEFAINSYRTHAWQGLGWASVGDYANISYLFADSSLIDSEFYDLLKSNFINNADRLLKNSKEDGYNISLTHYPWGSNMNLANNAMHLIIASLLIENQEYVDSAQDHLHYLLGRNALSQSYITGFGSNTVVNPHHRLSEAIGKTLPGMVAGGPNQNLQDPTARRLLEGKAPARTYIDLEPSYSTNEVTTYWNSPVLFLLSYFVK